MRFQLAVLCLLAAFPARPLLAGDEPPAPADASPLAVLDEVVAGSRCRGSPHGFYGSSEFLLWQLKSSPVPAPLLTTASFADPLPGAIGQPGTRVLLGSESIDTGMQPGVRVLLGYRTAAGHGIEGGYLYTASSTTQTVGTSGLPGSPNVAVPVFDVSGVSGLGGVPGQSIFVLPGPFGAAPAFRGVFQLGLTNRLQGADLNATTRLGDRGAVRFDGLAGFRWLELDETLTFSVATVGVPGSVVAGAFVNATDRFKTRNDFYGGQIGLRSTFESGRWSLGVAGKVALGNLHQTATITGSEQTSNGNLFLATQNTAGVVLPSGVFAQPSNVGTYTRDSFTVLPEATVNVGHQLTRNVRVFVGYNFMYLGSVVRPGDGIDPNINVTRTGLAAASRATVGTGSGPIPFGMPGPAPAASGPVAPVFRFNGSDFWVQGLNFGLAGRF